MKTLNRNKQTFHYAVYTGKTAKTDTDGYKTGDWVKTYGTVTEMKANISASKGELTSLVFGEETNYSREIVTDDMTCPINLETAIWIENATTAKHDYVVVGIAKSLNSITYAIRECDIT